MEKRTFNSSDLSWISVSLKGKSDVTIYEGDLSDCGNEIGYTVGKRYKNMTEEEKRQPLFIAYRASTKPEAERTVLERTYYRMFASAFDLVSALQENATKKIKKGRKRK